MFQGARPSYGATIHVEGEREDKNLTWLQMHLGDWF
jgi:hypothetical protein